MSGSQYTFVKKMFGDRWGSDPIVGIEIGTATGELTKAMLEGCPRLVLHSIDPWRHKEWADFEAGRDQPYHDCNLRQASDKLQGYMRAGRCHLYAIGSMEAKFKVPHEVDFVWIDGDHSDEGITQDLDTFESVVKPGVIFGGHDFGLVEGLTAIIRQRYGGPLLHLGDDFTWWIDVPA